MQSHPMQVPRAPGMQEESRPSGARSGGESRIDDEEREHRERHSATNNASQPSGPRAPAMDVPRVRVLGVRHHGPGSASAVVAALDRQDPDVVLIEGPPEADALVPWVGKGLSPPVALLSYVVDDPARSAFWPFAVFSPEWQAMAWAVRHHREVRFIDLPAATVLAVERTAAAEAEPSLFEPDSTPDADPDGETAAETAAEQELRDDPIAVLAYAAGYDDAERWWDDVVEQRRAPVPPTDGAGVSASSSTPAESTAEQRATDPSIEAAAPAQPPPDPLDRGDPADPFDAITEAMGVLRSEAPPVRSASYARNEARREAHMRQQLRAALRDHDRVAVVCGAWHAPALSGKLPPATADQRILRGLPKVKVQTTWVPWTHSRLAYASGYGAGVESPGWYEHLFTASTAPIERWFTAVAGELRRHDRPVSSAHAIEACRLADALAVMRGRPMPGLAEVQEAALAVMCDGSPLALEVVTRALVVGERLGTVPDEAPLVPLDADLRRLARSVRLTIAAEPKAYVLDLRREVDRGKSRLLRRLAILGVPWGRPDEVSGTGTFKEAWVVAWNPDFAVSIVLASQWGTTVESAATACLVADTSTLAGVAARVEQALLADLTDAQPPLLAALDERAAREADVTHLLSALPPLVRAQRYGTVRGTDTEALATVARAMLVRACAGLPAAVSGLSAAAADEMRRHLDAVTAVVGLLGDEARAEWLTALAAVAGRADLPGLLGGRIARVLLDSAVLDADEAGKRLSRALSYGPTVADRAAFAEGFLAGSALLLIHDTRILRVVDEWVRGLGEDDFIAVLPVIRRAFGSYNVPERRTIAERAAGLSRLSADPTTAAAELDLTQMADVLATVRLLLRGAA